MTQRPFRARTRWQSLQHALRGLHEAWQTQPNLRLHVIAGLAAIGLGAGLRLAFGEWLWLACAIGLVLFAELMNTAIEQTVDFVVGSRLDPTARRVKDLSAGGVLVASLLAAVIGAFTFLPHLLGA